MQMTLTQRDAWLDALNSGKYTQTSGCLRDSNGFCCLGVLETVEGTPSVKEGDDDREQHTFVGDGKNIHDSLDTSSLILTKKTFEKYKTTGWGQTSL